MSDVVFGDDLLARTLPKKECTIKMTMYLETGYLMHLQKVMI